MNHQFPIDLARLVHKRLLDDISHDRDTRVRPSNIPSIETLTKIFDVFYFASFQTEESRSIQLRVAYANPRNSDPDAPPRIRPDRWTFTKLAKRIPFSIREAIKLAKAADPWSSSLAIFSGNEGDLYVWGMVDQRVHFNTFLLREGGGGYDPPGIFEVTTNGVADITVYRGGAILGRLIHGVITEPETDVLWVGPLSQRLNKSILTLRTRVRRKAGKQACEATFWGDGVEDLWKATLCRILVGIQRYRHGGALLFARGKSDLNVKYSMRYDRVRDGIEALAIHDLRAGLARNMIHDRFLEEGRRTIPTDLYMQSIIEENDAEDRRAQLTGCVRFVASLSSIDGLVLVRPDFQVVGFGVEITTQADTPNPFACSGEELGQFNDFAPFWPGSHETTPVAEAPRVLMYWTGPDYISAMKIPLLQGRYFTAQDSTNSERVTVVDNVLAEKYFAGKNPIGESITINLWGSARIIGVVGHIRHSGLGDPAALTQVQAYAPLAQFPDKFVRSVYGGLTFVVRTPLDGASILPQIEAAVSGQTGGQPIYEIHTMQDIIADSMTAQRFPMIFLGVFAGLALLLASIGLYGVVSYSIAQRVREIGIRMALGAERSRIFQMVIRQGIQLAVAGVVIGAAATLFLVHAVSSFSHLLYGVGTSDPATFLCVSLVLLTVAILACWLPARRATHVNPMIALRNE